MSLVVVGSIAFDGIKTPFGTVKDALGGSGTHAALAAALFTKTHLVGVVGDDFPSRHRRMLADHDIDLGGVQTVKGGRTFRWTGEYSEDMNSRETLSVELNVLAEFNPDLPPSYRDVPYLFLANNDPGTQLRVLDQMRGNPFVLADTMDLWIRTQHDRVEELLRRIDGVVLNDTEASLYTGKRNLVVAGHQIRALGLRYVIIKKGEHGALLFHDGGEVYLPARPLAEVRDPTGAGDSFAGALMGFLAASGQRDLASLKRAVAWGTVVASACCEGFGVERLALLTKKDVKERFDRYVEMISLA